MLPRGELMMTVHVIHKFAKVKEGSIVVDACNNNPDGEYADINPFLVGPCELYDNMASMTVENGWQYSKVYLEHCDFLSGTETGTGRTATVVSDRYWKWARAGWNNPVSVRYPMGKGRVPLFSLWKGEALDYIQARRKIYGPLFIKAVQNTDSFNRLRELASVSDVYIRDWDGWNMAKYGMSSLTDVLNCRTRKMGHAFFLKAVLDDDPVLELLDL